MKIFSLQKAFNGSGNAPYRLHKELLAAGIKSFMFQEESIIENTYIQKMSRSKINFWYKIFNYIIRKIIEKYKDNQSYYYHYPTISHNITKNPDIISADIIIINWVQGNFLNLKNIEQILQLGKPTFFYLHDLWLLTGGCHHHFSCKQIYTNCKNCNMFKGIGKILPILQMKHKQNLYNKYQSNIYVLSPSYWVADIVNTTFFARKRNHCFTTPPIIDTNIFKKTNKFKAREKLGINSKMKIISFGCFNVNNNKYKGFDYLLEAINHIKHDNIMLVIYGTENISEYNINVPYKLMGIIKEETELAIISNASDVFVNPSLIETYGLTIAENLLCGTPVVAFNNSAITELIDHKNNGYLANNRDFIDLAKGIDFCLDLGKENIVFNYNKDALVSNYIKIFKDVLKRENDD